MGPATSCGKNDVPFGWLARDANHRGERDKVFQQELAVLEVAKQAEIHDHTDSEQHPSPVLRLLDKKAFLRRASRSPSKSTE